MENANLLFAIPVSGQLFTRRSNFLNFHKRLITDYALFGRLNSLRVCRIYGRLRVTQYVRYQIERLSIGVISTDLEAAWMILYEFAYHQLGDSGNAGMYSYFPMKFMLPVPYFALIRQVS